MRNVLIALMAWSLSSTKVFACLDHPSRAFFPESSFSIPVHQDKKKQGERVTEKDFNNLMLQLNEEFSPQVKARGGELRIVGLWNSSTINAYAIQPNNFYIVTMLGGLARHPLMTLDGLMLVACHELGHHLGGAPYYGGGQKTWASNEGQADYFATSKCMRRMLGSDARALERIKTASLNLAKVLADMSARPLNIFGFRAKLRKVEEVSLNEQDARIVERTIDDHTNAQCRLDTYVAGTRCDISEFISFDPMDPSVGACSQFESIDAARPPCWYKEELEDPRQRENNLFANL